MTGEPPRHVLVVGAQCTDMGPLARLEEAAEGLHAVLTAPALGGCTARPGDHGSLLVSATLEPDDVRKAMHEAVRRAKADSAVLVVALLGHGFTPPQQTDLHYMVAQSTTRSTMSAVNVRQLLAEAVDEPGVEGVIALIDTCHAAGAAPDAGGIAGGVRAGRTRLSVLSASASDQAARGMRLTFALIDVLREGLNGAGAMVFVDTRLTEELRGRIVGQVVGRFEYDSDPYALDGLWLAHNMLSASGGGGVVGPVGRQDLEEVVSLWRANVRLPVPLTLGELDDLHRFAQQGRTEDATDSRWQARVIEVVGTLVECARTVTLLNKVLAEVLTSDLLREARQLSGLPHEAEGAELLRDLVEYAALRARKLHTPPWQAPARLLAALAHLSGASGADKAIPQLRAWAQEHGVVTAFNDALTEFAQLRRQGELRLVLSLAGALTDWPEEVDAWLVGSGERLPVHQSFRCEPADRPGVGRAMGKALAWARGRLPDPEQLVNVDVAAPVHLLARWHPEEAKVGLRLLGVNRTVVARWSGRMDPAEENAEMNDAARRALRRMAAGGAVPVEWIDATVLGDRQGLEQSLMTGRYDTAVGIDHHPETLQDVLEELLPYAPIILWPRPEARAGDGTLRALVDQHWHSLPNGFARAYQQRWDRDHDGCVSCLGEIRAVWHDEAWLEFCRPFENRVVAGLEEEL
ncbi:hypothetical protein [Streptomyces sp. NPDC101165]|uniref:vWA-MoxR associated conflict system protein n=1 Tax=Streptomyces sp. NPDC101165 TaxID=3366119 RepID=UPI0037F689A9